jgi:hypothetical protein
MCQVLNKRIHAKSVKCYRVYEDGKSYYSHMPYTPLGVPTMASRNTYPFQPIRDTYPFHAFRAKKDVEKWLKYGDTHSFPRGDFDVFECTLEGNLLSGEWADSNQTSVRTCTGKILTRNRLVGTHVTGNPIQWKEPK